MSYKRHEPWKIKKSLPEGKDKNKRREGTVSAPTGMGDHQQNEQNTRLGKCLC
jgi:hypothetical protein